MVDVTNREESSGVGVAGNPNHMKANEELPDRGDIRQYGSTRIC